MLVMTGRSTCFLFEYESRQSTIFVRQTIFDKLGNSGSRGYEADKHLLYLMRPIILTALATIYLA